MKKTIKTLTRSTVMVIVGLAAGVHAVPVGHVDESSIIALEAQDAQPGHGAARANRVVSGAWLADAYAIAGAAFGTGFFDLSNATFADAVVHGHAMNVASVSVNAWLPRVGSAALAACGDCGLGGGGVRWEAGRMGAADLLAGLGAPSAGHQDHFSGSFETQALGQSMMVAAAPETGSIGGSGMFSASGLYGYQGEQQSATDSSGAGAASSGGNASAGSPGTAPRNGGAMDMVTASSGQGQVSPVPEPHTYALMLAGLVALVFLGGKRN